MYRISALALLAAVVGCGVSTTETIETGEAAPAIETPAIELTVETTTVSFNPDNAPVVELEAPGMHCELCAAKLMTTLRETPGVVDVTADAETKLVKVAYTEGGFEEKIAIDAIDDLGFGPKDEEAAEGEAAVAESVEAEAPAAESSSEEE